MSDIWQRFSTQFGSALLTLPEFQTFIDGEMAIVSNFEVAGSTATAFYAGKFGDAQSYQIAQDLAARSGGKLRIIDNTDMGKFLNQKLQDGKVGFEINKSTTTPFFDSASENFAANTKGRVVTVTSNAEESSTFFRKEIPAILKNSGITTVDGIDLKTFKGGIVEADQQQAFRRVFGGAFAGLR